MLCISVDVSKLESLRYQQIYVNSGQDNYQNFILNKFLLGGFIQ